MKAKWDTTGQRRYETGVDQGVLYEIDSAGEYVNGVPWNGLISVTNSPSGAEATPHYANNSKYLNLVSAEEFAGSLEAFTYPKEFEKHDGEASPAAGVTIGQQNRKSFGFSYRSRVGNDIEGNDFGYKIHLIYGALAAPSEKAHSTVNESVEPVTFSWEISTTPVEVGVVNGTSFKPTAKVVIDSTACSPSLLADLEEILYGTESTNPMMPLPADIIAMMTTPLQTVEPAAPTYNSSTKTITIPTVTGVVYKIAGVTKTGNIVIAADTVVKAYPTSGYKFPEVSDDDWFFDF